MPRISKTKSDYKIKNIPLLLDTRNLNKINTFEAFIEKVDRCQLYPSD